MIAGALPPSQGALARYFKGLPAIRGRFITIAMPVGMPAQLLVADRAVPLEVRRHARARRISIRIDHASRAIVLVLPRRASLAEGLRFVEEKRRWLESRLRGMPRPVALVPGAAVPLLGRERVICHDPERPRRVVVKNGAIHLGGPLEMVPRRLETWLKGEAKRLLEAKARAMAERIGKTPRRITVRDTTSRWGSCSASGDLSFSWRLLLAPEAVLDYVVAHEVAHLKHMHHGARFWGLVGKLVGDHEPARRWLREHGLALHRYG